MSTAFLFAKLSGEDVVVSMPEGCRGLGVEKLYLRLKKALYGLRSAAPHWTKHLAGLLERLFSLKSCPTEPCLFAGEYRGKRVLLLAYVDDILLSCEDTGLMYEMVEKLGAEVKLKVTADLARDGEITFLGHKILRSEPQGSLKFGMDPGYLDDVMEECNLKGAKGCPNPPNLRDLYDRALESEELSRPLSQEASARFRRALGKMAWLATTRGGQADPREYHERAIRGTLRYLQNGLKFLPDLSTPEGSGPENPRVRGRILGFRAVGLTQIDFWRVRHVGFRLREVVGQIAAVCRSFLRRV